MWPRKAEYQQAVRNPAAAFDDPDLAAAQVELERDGTPRVQSGGHAAVFQLTTARGKVAVRCFLNQTVDRQARYAAIRKGLAALRNSGRSPFSEFEYVQKGICVHGIWYPILKMNWTEGLLLSDFLQANRLDGGAVRSMANKWLSASKLLRSARVAHGNLQPPNIFAGNEIKLIDYDGVFVPLLQGRQSEELGSVDYQHPQRTHAHFGDYLDNFSDWVIYCSLVAISADPRFCKFVNFEQNQLLFRRDDFVAPSESEVFYRLKNHSSAELRTLGSTIESSLRLPVDQVPALDPPQQEAVSAPAGSNAAASSSAVTMKEPVARIGGDVASSGGASGDTTRRKHKDVLDLDDATGGAQSKASKPPQHAHPSLIDDSGNALPSPSAPPPAAPSPNRSESNENIPDFSGTFPRLAAPREQSSAGFDRMDSSSSGQSSGGFNRFDSSMAQSMTSGFQPGVAPENPRTSVGFDQVSSPSFSTPSPQNDFTTAAARSDSASVPPPKTSSLRASQAAESEAKPKSNGGPAIVMVTLIVVGLAGAGIFYWLYGRGTATATSTGPASSATSPSNTTATTPGAATDPATNTAAITETSTATSVASSSTTDGKPGADELIKQGLSLIEAKNAKDAIEKFSQALAVDADDARAYGGRADAYMALKRYAEGLDDFNKALTLDPENKQFFKGRGLAFLCLEQYLKAAADYKKGISLGLDDPGVYSDLGKCYGGLGEFQTALEYFNQSLERKANANTYYLRGGTFYCLKKYSEAEADYRKAVALNPKDADAWYGIGSCLYCFKRYSEAKVPFKKAVELYKAGGKKAWAVKAEAFLKEVSANKR